MGNSVDKLIESAIYQRRNFHPLKKSLLAFLALALLFLNFSQALMVKLSLQRLTIGSDAIILGEVENMQCEWSLDGQIILSVVTLRIDEILKGEFSNSKIFIQYPGGTVGELSLKVTDMPSFHRKEKVLVFLKSITDMTDTKNSPLAALNILPAFKVFGNAQGKYFIDAQARAKRSGYNLTARDVDPDKTLSLTKLKARIKNILKHQSEEREKIYDKSKH
jgi:hypothetical protein